MSIVIILQFLGKLLQNAKNLNSLFVGPILLALHEFSLVEYRCLLDISLQASSLYTT